MKRLLILGLLLLAGCGGEAVAYTTHNSESLGISFEYPEAWVLDAHELEVNVATEATLFAANTADFQGGAVANISAFPMEAIGDDVVTAVTQFAGFVAANETAEPLGEEVESLTIKGREAARTTVALTTETKMEITMISGDEEMIVVAAVYNDEEYREPLRHVAESVTFGE